MSGSFVIILAFSCLLVNLVSGQSSTEAPSSTTEAASSSTEAGSSTEGGGSSTEGSKTTTKPATTTTRWVRYPCDSDDDCIPPDQCIQFRESDGSQECTDPDFETGEILQGGNQKEGASMGLADIFG